MAILETERLLIEEWQPEKIRPFGYIGVALGLQ